LENTVWGSSNSRWLWPLLAGFSPTPTARAKAIGCLTGSTVDLADLITPVPRRYREKGDRFPPMILANRFS